MFVMPIHSFQLFFPRSHPYVVMPPSVLQVFVRSYTNTVPSHGPLHTELTTKMVEAAKTKGAEVRSIDA